MTLDPNQIPNGHGWIHRIDDIPAVGSETQIVTTNGRILDASVIAASQELLAAFRGIGCHVAYQCGDEIISSANVAWFRPK